MRVFVLFFYDCIYTKLFWCDLAFLLLLKIKQTLEYNEYLIFYDNNVDFNICIVNLLIIY